MRCVAPVLLKRRGGVSSNSNQYVGCGRCIPCRLDYSSQWATRCVHEASLHQENAFITLTFSDAHLPRTGSLSVRTAQLFLKRLRKAVGPFRYFLAGEYGSETARPHYHALLFGKSFPDAVPISSRPGLAESDALHRVWPYGFNSVGDVNFQTAAYVARYCVKKVNGGLADAHYQGRLPEFCLMSRRPGIGRGWIDLYRDEVFPRDEVRVNGFTRTPPRYYLDSLPADARDAVKSARAKSTFKRRDSEQQRAYECTVLHHHHQRKRAL